MSDKENKSVIFVVDDETRMVEMIQMMLRKEGYEVDGFSSPVAALDAMRDRTPDVLISDLKMPEMSGIELMKETRRLYADVEVIMITAFSSVETAVEAMKLGARDYITKPFPANALRATVQFALDQREMLIEGRANGEDDEGEDTGEAETKRSEAGAATPLDNMIATSPVMQSVIDKALKVARSHSSVLIQAESGSGKEVLAKAIHKASNRANGPWLKVNCAAIPESLLESQLFGYVKGAFTGADSARDGLFKTADGGTLFLDEIGEIPIALQVKLLHVLQEGEFMRVGDTKPQRVDVRIIAATNKNLEEEMRRGNFRQDLYFRLNVVPIYVPPLRERLDDIPLLIDHFKNRFNPGKSPVKIDNDAMNLLQTYPYPGNIRELENAIEHAIVLCDDGVVRVGDLPAALQNFHHKHEVTLAGPAMGSGGADEYLPLEDQEKKSILRSLERAGFNHTRAAKLLGITRRTLGYRIKKYELDEKIASLKQEWQNRKRDRQ